MVHLTSVKADKHKSCSLIKIGKESTFWV